MSEKIPNYCSSSVFCASRIKEIKELDLQLANCEHGLRAFQKLPRNLQRRAVSRNPQRLPRSLREKNKREIGNVLKTNKRPCRKYRRRPANLLTEYNRRQRKQIWMETHIWHAKRFHMMRKWGYVLPNTPTIKSYRPTLRAATNSCMIQDVSYESCFEIEGSFSHVHDPLSCLLTSHDVVNLRDEKVMNGQTWIEPILYKPHKYPFEAVGGAQMIWGSVSSEGPCKLWIWVHPSTYEEILSILIEVFNYIVIENEPISDCLSSTDVVTDAKIASKNIPIQKAPSYKSEFTKLTILKDTLIKFRLTGPRSYSILSKVLMPSQVSVNNNNNRSNKDDSGTAVQDKNKTPWWVPFYSDPDHVKGNDLQLSVWNSLSGGTSVNRNAVSLVIRDVRVTLPTKKVAFEDEEEGDLNQEVVNIDRRAVHPLFDSNIRENVIYNMKSTSEVNKERENMLVPGALPQIKDDESRVPVLLLQRPASYITELGSGWDLIFPCGWATQTLVSFVLNGAVVAGQKEEETLMRELLISPTPIHLPDTAAGQLYNEQVMTESEHEYFKKPPNCRANYLKMGIKFPFGINWLEFIKDFDASCKQFYVLRDRTYLKWLTSKSCKKIEKITQKKIELTRKRKASEEDENVAKKLMKGEEKSLPVSLKIEERSLQIALKELKYTLLYIRLIVTGKGSLESLATICLPTAEDLKAYMDNRCCEILEELHEDKNAEKRTALKNEHQKNLNYLRRKRRKARDDVLCHEENPLKNHSTMKEALDAAVDTVCQENKEMLKNIEAYNANMNKLWFEAPEEKIQSNARKIIGFVTHEGFCMRLGRPGGLGYVVTEPLLEHMSKIKMIKDDSLKTESDASNNWPTQTQILVLTRNPSTLQYKWARLVILNI